jgi:hypothetical protein
MKMKYTTKIYLCILILSVSAVLFMGIEVLVDNNIHNIFRFVIGVIFLIVIIILFFIYLKKKSRK